MSMGYFVYYTKGREYASLQVTEFYYCELSIHV